MAVGDLEFSAAAQPVDGGQAELFARLAVELHESGGVTETVQAVVEFALSALSCSHAGVALCVHGKPEVPASTDPLVAEIYEWQTERRIGPLIEAMGEHRALLIRDTATAGRWPEWSAKVLSLGVRSVLDMPLTTATGTVGVLCLYHVQPDAFGLDDEAVAAILARHTSVAVATARREQGMTAAVDARKLVGQAMGILMERYDVDADRGFAILKRYSQDSNTKLRDVAQRLITTRSLPGWRA
ncbi:GAF and ANTAR domain-containing protein [Kribbella sp. NPDC005582]|uniref:GAF and ANTAR domain-containing protein n=1 Tax=Kribbella sp. NPDC005582 TaxID=3156893 RepID=UPI0033A43B3D